ncbi:MAG: ABC transporter substrate-binding protein [Acidimicrobiia bacterium]|nr:ABC transporter substrate-binding protein [Acidimicrobiia bacterium]
MGRSSRTARLLAACSAALVLVVGACADGDGAASDQPDGAEPSPVSGGVLRLAIERPEHLDPALARSVPQSELIVADLLFDGLTAYDDQRAEVVPALAERWGASADQRRWRFRLREGATFASGKEITAAEVKASLDRITAEGSASPAAPGLARITKVSATQADLVTIALDAPLATLPEVLSNPALGIVPASAGPVGTKRFDLAPDGSGPFVLADDDNGLRGDDAIRLRRARGADTLLDGVELQIHEELADAAAAVRQSEADWSLVPDDELGAEEKGRSDDPFAAMLFYGLNANHPDLGDVRFRQAIVRAIDRESILEEVYDGTLVPRNGVVPIGVPGAAEDPCGERCAFDPERARALVKALYPSGGVPTVAIDHDDGRHQQQVAEAIESDLEAVGIPAEPRSRPFLSYIDFVGDDSQEMFRLGSTGAYPSADAYLSPLFAAAGADDAVGLTQPNVEAALAEARSTPDPEQRFRLLARVERLTMREIPVVPLGQFRTPSLQSDRTQDLELSLTGTFDAPAVWLSPNP